MRRNMSGNLGLYKYLWPGSVYFDDVAATNPPNALPLVNYNLKDCPQSNTRHTVRSSDKEFQTLQQVIPQLPYLHSHHTSQMRDKTYFESAFRAQIGTDPPGNLHHLLTKY